VTQREDDRWQWNNDFIPLNLQ